VLLSALVYGPPAGAASFVGTTTAADAFSSASRFFTHCANGYCWVAYHDGTTGPVVYSSPDGLAWANQGGIFTFNPVSAGQWAARFSGTNLIAFARKPTNPQQNRRFYRNATLNGNGIPVWNDVQQDASGALSGQEQINALIAGGKPYYWVADGAPFTAGDEGLGTTLNNPTLPFFSPAPGVGPPTLSNATAGQFSAGAFHMTGGADPGDFIVLRATTLPTYTLGAHRLVAAKLDVSIPDYVSDLTWYNVSLDGCPACSPAIPFAITPEDAVTEVKPGLDVDAHLRFAAVRDTSGGLHAVYVNRLDNVVHYRKDVGFNDDWSRPSIDVTGAPEVIDRVALSAVRNDNLFLFYSKSDNGLYYKRWNGAAWLAEATLKPPSATPLQGALAPMEIATSCTLGIAWVEGALSPFNVMFSLVDACGELSTAVTSTTVSLETPEVRMLWDANRGGGLREFYVKNEANPGVSRVGAGARSNLFGTQVNDGTTWYHETQLGGTLHLLEATRTRARVRQRLDYIRGGAGVSLERDWTSYGFPRLGISDKLTIESAQTLCGATGVHAKGETTCPGNSFFCAGAPQPSPVGSDPLPANLVFLVTDNAASYSDMLGIPYTQPFFGRAGVAHTWEAGQEAGTPNSFWSRVNESAAPLTAAATHTRFYELLPRLAGLSSTGSEWQPWADDYRTPDVLSFNGGQGSPWQDPDENTGPGDFFNEAELAYLVELDPATGLSVNIDGDAPNRKRPFFKIRQWRSLLDPASVTLEGSVLVNDVDYRADVKPFARGHAAENLIWHCTLESATSCDALNLDVGSTGGVANVTIVPGRYGNGALVDSTADFVAAGTAASGDFNDSGGRVEFWYRPSYDHDDNLRHALWSTQSSDDCFFFEKTAANQLQFTIHKNATAGTNCSVGGTPYQATLGPAGYSWKGGDWVHLAIAGGNGGTLRIFVDGIERVQQSLLDSTGITHGVVYFGGCGGGTCPFGVTTHASGVIDEPHIYDQRLADLGMGGAPGDWFASPAGGLNYQFGFGTGVDGARRGMYLYLGSDSRFRGINVSLAGAGVGPADGALEWQYWDGTTWASLEAVAGFVEGTRAFKQNGTVSWTSDPSPWALYSVGGGPDLYYVRVHLANGQSYSNPPTETLIKPDILLFQYCGDITLPDQTFVFSPPIPTLVTLAGFAARGLDRSVSLGWETTSELHNLGFHLYRATSADGPWTRITPSLIRGLGSSPEGKAYAWLDTGLTNGVTYFYRLEDVDRSGLSTAHGPVSATPGASSAASPPAPDPPGAEPLPSPESSSAWTPHGEPSAGGLRVLRRSATSVTLELSTGGFYTLAQADGSTLVHVPGFFELSEPGLPRVPTRRAWVEVPAGSQVRVASVVPSQLVTFGGLHVGRAGAPQAIVEKGTYQTSFRRVRAATLRRGLFPEAQARVLETAFQGETKQAYLELAPLRVDAASGRVVLARRLVVRLSFRGRVAGERSRGGARGRLEPGAAARRTAPAGLTLAWLVARIKGLHAVSFEETASGLASHPLASAWLRLTRTGRAVAFHVEPRADRFGPGSTLYFMAEDPRAAYGNETVYELAIAPGGVQMPIGPLTRTRSLPTVKVPALFASRSFEQNTNYLPALLNARDLWFWDIGLLAPNGRDYPFPLSSPSAAAGSAVLSLDLHGGTDAARVDPDHQVRIFVNGVPVGEARWDGLNPFHFESSFDASILTEANALRLENLDTTGAFDSVVYLDRFSVQYPHALAAAAGRLEGRAPSSGRVEAAGFFPGSLLLDVTGASPRWLTPVVTESGLAFPAEAHSRYLALSPEAVARAEVRGVAPSSLREGSLQADWIVIAPQELLPAAEPLLLQRESQGLRAVAVSLEEIRDQFGFGERSPQAIRDFLATAYHRWAAPSLRYVLLLGDATYDPKGFLTTTTRRDLVPSPLTKSTFLWTASDPALAAVNGDDAIPDLAIGRLSAGSLAEAEVAIQKILAFEDGGQTLAGNAVLVADNPDLAGNFEANANDIASLLPGRPLDRIFLSALGSGTRSAVLGAFDAGASLFSYVGHGSQGLWASEGILRSPDVALLRPQARQPLLLAMTCSNGYFISPWSNALSERLVLAGDKGAIAAFSPSGLSLDDAAHVFHRAIVQQLESGRHERLGDLVLAAQKDYAETGALSELLSLYHLFADPALKVQSTTLIP